MFNFFIPDAQAQSFFNSVTQTASAGKNAVVEKSENGITSLFSYIASNIDNWIAGIFIIVIFFLMGKMAASAIKKTILKKRDDVQESALILVERITKITILTIGVVIAFALNGLNFTAVLGALSLGVGFALKDIIGNFISGVIMLSQNRINIGDYIKVGEKISGTIVSIDTRATILQAIDGTEIVIPNQTMLGETLVSYTTNPFRRVDFTVGVDYKTDLAMATSLIKAILDKEEAIVVKPAPSVLVKEFGESSITLAVRFWVETGSGWMRIKSNILHKVKKAFDKVGISIPFPIRTLKLDESDRAFLKTMDDLKKGVVPDPQEAPSKADILSAALMTEHMDRIPYKIMEEYEKQGLILSPEAMKPAAAEASHMDRIDPLATHEDKELEKPSASPLNLYPENPNPLPSGPEQTPALVGIQNSSETSTTGTPSINSPSS